MEAEITMSSIDTISTSNMTTVTSAMNATPSSSTSIPSTATTSSKSSPVISITTTITTMEATNSTTTFNWLNCMIEFFFAGDGFCNDFINIESCDYDGNDCCLPIISDYACKECICHEDGTRHQSFGNEGITNFLQQPQIMQAKDKSFM